MALSEGQQQTLRQIGQRSRTEDVSFEDEAGKFMQQSLSPEEQQQVPEFEGQPEGLVAEKGKFDKVAYEKGLEEHGFLNRANALAETRLDLDFKNTQNKEKESALKAETTLLGMQLIKAGDLKGGIDYLNTTLPEGMRVKDVKNLANNKSKVFTEDRPEGFVVDGDQMITAMTKAATQYQEKAAMDRLIYKEQMANRRAKNNPDKKPSTDQMKAQVLRKQIMRENLVAQGQTVEEVEANYPDLRMAVQEQRMIDKYNWGDLVGEAMAASGEDINAMVKRMGSDVDPVDAYVKATAKYQKGLVDALKGEGAGPKAKQPSWLSDGILEKTMKKEGKTKEEVLKQINKNPDKAKRILLK